ncbi:flagellar biosynthetic protein FliO [Yersinia aleksiciae]|uniref:flagellar biosynthetic protein FliO n=1 Tax=Yersinia aleksiciae TaxID=263819 RepID=UPI001427D503|nr:flagellar biosynthetic protein FliO [Yersinia aleksiciae]MDA5498376.1 flagellar biosynthetic protein FliO [Yersinia aleksiciae]NIL00702.1 flagellar biosynthetic protein FliO [Yersinia aleksiciae]WQC72183.1 flagellar biosynthetic protein FliO [Yersinia aleksiciae]
MSAAQTVTAETTPPAAEATGVVAMPVTTNTPITTAPVPTTGFAASHPGIAVQQTAPAIPAGSVLTQVGSVLGGILLLILCGAWLVRRLGFAPQARNNTLLNVKASCQVGQRERVVIVEVDNTWLVLGVTSQQVTQLHTLPRPPVDDSASELSAKRAKPADFRQLLNHHLFNKKSKHPEKTA